MPLPPALAARLQRRGILSNDQQENEHHEEVIAEDYDDLNKPIEGGKKRQTVFGCPNKYNIYHDCSAYCQKRWGTGKQEPSPRTKRKYQKLIKRYPLTEGWQDVYDPGVGVYYFWNTNTDEVSWLPPHHPKARISLSAEKMKELIRDDDEEEEIMGSESGSSSQSDSSLSDEEMSQSDSDSDKIEFVTNKQDISHRRKDRKIDEREKQSKGREIRKHNDLDPMDPASYSDIPRGKWSDGLEKKSDGKTAADSTASGPLYQMRPYPNPGTVLKMNKKSNKSSSDED